MWRETAWDGLVAPGLGGAAASAEHVAVRLEDLEGAAGEFVLDESVIRGDGMPEGKRMVQNGARWEPAKN